MPQIVMLRGDLELRTRITPLAESDDAEWVSVAHDLDTWPGAREVARLGIRGDRARQARKLFSYAALAHERDREILRDMVARGIQVRIAATSLPQGTIIIGRRAIILSGPATHSDRTYTMSVAPALIGGAYSLFEAAWETAADLATFFSSQRPRMDAQARVILRALGSGVTDEAAARELGMSLRTYRRRVAELLIALDAGSRFQAGVRVGELGLTT
jgi:hypothetical protein